MKIKQCEIRLAVVLCACHEHLYTITRSCHAFYGLLWILNRKFNKSKRALPLFCSHDHASSNAMIELHVVIVIVGQMWFDCSFSNGCIYNHQIYTRWSRFAIALYLTFYSFAHGYEDLIYKYTYNKYIVNTNGNNNSRKYKVHARFHVFIIIITIIYYFSWNTFVWCASFISLTLTLTLTRSLSFHT